MADDRADHHDVADSVTIDVISAVNRKDLALPLDPYRSLRLPHAVLGTVLRNLEESLKQLCDQHEEDLLAAHHLAGLTDWARPILEKKLEGDPLWVNLQGLRSVVARAVELGSDLEVVGK